MDQRNAADLSAAMSGGLVRDLPDAVDPEQIVKVDPSIGSRVKAQLPSASMKKIQASS